MAVWKNLVIGAVLMIATMHCVQCIFFDNVSLLNLPKYARGQENMPFQGRVAMMPVLRWGGHRYAATIASLSPDSMWGSEKPTAEKSISYKAGFYSLEFLVLLLARYGFQNGRELWWLCPALTVLSFYISYGARENQNYWYPYDLPHAALFSAACLFLLDGKWPIMMAFFLADVPMRETSLYLVPCLLAVGWVQGKRAKAFLYSSAMTVVWLVVHLIIARKFQANPRDIWFHRYHFYVLLHFHRDWPQVMSVFGYLWLPLAFLRHFLTRKEVALIAGAVPGLLVTSIFGIWYETRVWSEWNGVVSFLLFAAVMRLLESRGLTKVSQAQLESSTHTLVSPGESALQPN